MMNIAQAHHLLTLFRTIRPHVAGENEAMVIAYNIIFPPPPVLISSGKSEPEAAIRQCRARKAWEPYEAGIKKVVDAIQEPPRDGDDERPPTPSWRKPRSDVVV